MLIKDEHTSNIIFVTNHKKKLAIWLGFWSNLAAFGQTDDLNMTCIFRTWKVQNDPTVTQALLW